MEISHVEHSPEIVVITVAGKIMLSTGSEQIEILTGEFIEKGYRRFVYDVSGVTHMDSTGIGRFIAVLNRLMKLGGQLRIAGAHGIFRDSFRVTRLDTVFRFEPDVETAAASFA